MSTNTLRALVCLVLVCALPAGPAQARKAFLLTAESEGETGRADYAEIEDMANALTDAGLARVVSTYTPNSAVLVELDVRGLPATAIYAKDSPILAFEVPSLDIRVSFKGATRDDSQKLFEDWLKGEGRDLLTRMLQGLAAVSPIDPVAGNPNSLMAQMASADFEVGSEASTNSFEAVSDRMVALGARFGSYSVRGYDAKVYTLPLGYTLPLPDPAFALIIDAPITYIDNNGSDTYQGSLGLGLRFPVLDQQAVSWRLTPALRLGGVGSVDLGSASWVYSASVTSNLNLYPMSETDFKIIVGNMAGYYQTSKVSAADFEVDYDLRNWVVRNAIGIETGLPYKLIGQRTSVQLTVADTRFFGDELFIEQYNEIALSVGTKRQKGSAQWKSLRMGLTITVGDKGFDGYRLNAGYRF